MTLQPPHLHLHTQMLVQSQQLTLRAIQTLRPAKLVVQNANRHYMETGASVDARQISEPRVRSLYSVPYAPSWHINQPRALAHRVEPRSNRRSSKVHRILLVVRL